MAGVHDDAGGRISMRRQWARAFIGRSERPYAAV
jgi:hypothetical protein